MENENDKKNKLNNFEKYCYNILLKKYNTSSNELNKIVISNIIYNEKLHIVSCFKEFLIFYDPGEFLSDFYKAKECKTYIKTYSEFYSLNSRIFPNYILLTESKYIFNNIKKKQKLIDNIEDNNNNNMKHNNENNQNILVSYSEINSEYSLPINDTKSSYYSTIFTPSIIKSIKNDFDTSIISHISKVNSIIDNINKFQNINKGNYSIFKTPKNKNEIIIESENKKKAISSLHLFTIDKNKKNNSNKINKSKNKIIPNYNKEKEKDKILKEAKEKLIDTEKSNND